MEILAGKHVESLYEIKGAREIGRRGSSSFKIIAGVQEVGFFLSPNEKIREKRILESTPRAKGRVTIITTSDTFRLKDSNVKSLSINRGKSSGVYFDSYFSNVIHFNGSECPK